jgi:hypothetical protein
MFKILDNHWIEGWRTEALKLHSIQISLFWGAVSGLLLVWPAFASAVPLWVYASASIFMCMALGYARLTKQPGVADGF